MTLPGGNGNGTSATLDTPPEFDEAVRDAVCSACYDVFGDASEHKWEGIADRILEEIIESAAQLYAEIEQREIERAEEARRVLSLEGAKRILGGLREQGHSEGCLCTLCRASRMVGHSYGVAL